MELLYIRRGYPYAVALRESEAGHATLTEGRIKPLYYVVWQLATCSFLMQIQESHDHSPAHPKFICGAVGLERSQIQLREDKQEATLIKESNMKQWVIAVLILLGYFTKHPQSLNMAMSSKVLNLKGLPLRVSMFPRQPTAIPVGHSVSPEKFTGKDGEALSNLERYMNFTVWIVTPAEEKEEYGRRLRPIIRIPRTLSQKLLIICCIFFSLIMSSVFEGRLVTTITKPDVSPDIVNLQQLDESQLMIATGSKTLDDTFRTTDRHSYLTRLSKKIKHLGKKESVMNYIAEHMDVAGIVRKSSYQYQMSEYVEEDGNSPFYMIPECPRQYFLAYIVPKGSVFLPRINRYLLHLTQGGLFIKWDADSMFRILLDRNHNLTLSSGRGPKVFTVKEGFANQIDMCRGRGLNPGPPPQKSDTLPLYCQVTHHATC
uniref:Uncharacterized protein n=1 Tax=Timema poppense TaxID=170557 RepID=A0A7R9CU26_TIMPO|nr:unnamed protein product [Timema poppensis]